jgi:hypothetical protein
MRKKEKKEKKERKERKEKKEKKRKKGRSLEKRREIGRKRIYPTLSQSE